MRRHRFVLVALSALLFTTSAPAAAADSVNVAYVNANDFVPAFVAKDTGIFAKHNLDVTLKPQRIISQIPVALQAGAIDIGSVPPTVLLQSREGGVDLVAIAGASRQERKSPTISLVTNVATIRTAEDLKGKKIGVPGLYGGLDVTLREWLRSKNVPTSSVTFVELPLTSLGEMLTRNQVDAVAVIEPVRSRILGQPGVTKIADYLADLRDDINLVFWGSAFVRDVAPRCAAALSCIARRGDAVHVGEP